MWDREAAVVFIEQQYVRCADYLAFVSSFSIFLLSTRTTLRFNGHFPGGPGLAGTITSPFWILLELRTMVVVVTTGAIRRAKLQSNRHQQTNIQFSSQAGCPSCCPTNSVSGDKKFINATLSQLLIYLYFTQKLYSYIYVYVCRTCTLLQEYC